MSGPPIALLPVREQAHRALALLGVPASPRLVADVHAVFFTGDLAPGGLARLCRDEERDFAAAPHDRPYYICPALSAARLTAVPGLLTLSTWALHRRVVGPSSARVDLLTAAARVAELAAGLPGASGASTRLVRRFAVGIAGAVEAYDVLRPATVAAAARAELARHRDADDADRTEAAARARATLDDHRQLFGGGA